MSTNAPSGRVTWFEVASTYVAQWADFYAGLFGWSFHGDPVADHVESGERW